LVANTLAAETTNTSRIGSGTSDILLWNFNYFFAFSFTLTPREQTSCISLEYFSDPDFQFPNRISESQHQPKTTSTCIPRIGCNKWKFTHQKWIHKKKRKTR
jgi:hypothetical protein